MRSPKRWPPRSARSLRRNAKTSAIAVSRCRTLVGFFLGCFWRSSDWCGQGIDEKMRMDLEKSMPKQVKFFRGSRHWGCFSLFLKIIFLCFPWSAWISISTDGVHPARLVTGIMQCWPTRRASDILNLSWPMTAQHHKQLGNCQLMRSNMIQ